MINLRQLESSHLFELLQVAIVISLWDYSFLPLFLLVLGKVGEDGVLEIFVVIHFSELVMDRLDVVHWSAWSALDLGHEVDELGPVDQGSGVHQELVIRFS